MSRWPKFEERRRSALLNEIRAQLPPNIAGTIRPTDVLIGKRLLVAEAQKHVKSTGQQYAMTNTLSAQKFMLHVGSSQFPATLVNTARHWFAVERFELERKIRASLPHADYGRMGGRGNKKA